MREHRNVAKIVAGVVVMAGVLLGTAIPAQAYDTGWNGTRIISDTDRPGNR